MVRSKSGGEQRKGDDDENESSVRSSWLCFFRRYLFLSLGSRESIALDVADVRKDKGSRCFEAAKHRQNNPHLQQRRHGPERVPQVRRQLREALPLLREVQEGVLARGRVREVEHELLDGDGGHDEERRWSREKGIRSLDCRFCLCLRVLPVVLFSSLSSRGEQVRYSRSSEQVREKDAREKRARGGKQKFPLHNQQRFDLQKEE